MIINKTENESGITLAPIGWLDTASSAELGTFIDEISSASAITLDFDKVEYIASAGIRQVVTCCKKAKELSVPFAVINVTKEVMNIFRLTGIDKKLDIREKE